MSSGVVGEWKQCGRLISGLDYILEIVPECSLLGFWHRKGQMDPFSKSVAAVVRSPVLPCVMAMVAK